MRERFFVKAGLHTPAVLASTEHGDFLVNTSDTHIGRTLFQKRHYGDKQLILASRILENFGGKRGELFVDVGAHIGTSTVVALRACGFSSALALEPEPANYRLLKVNLELNGLAASVEALQMAASERSGTLGMAVLDARSGEHHVVNANRRSVRREGARIVDVPAITLDDLGTQGKLSEGDVGLLKIDVEGHELAVLRGARTLLSRATPTMIEFAPELLRASGELEALQTLLADQFDELYDLRGGVKRESAISGGDLPDPMPVSAIAELTARYAHHFTDLLLVRR